MQGSVNRLTDIMDNAFKPENLAAPHSASTVDRKNALRLLQERDEGISDDEKVSFCSILMRSDNAVTTYLALEVDRLRQAWMKQTLRELVPASSM
jgi:hypothetical protein